MISSCTDASIYIKLDNTMGGSSGNVTWTLETESGDVILSGGPL